MSFGSKYGKVWLAGAALLCATASMQAQKPLISDDFESGKIDTSRWEQRVSGSTTLSVEQVDGAHGKYALKVHSPAMAERNSYGFLFANSLPASARTHFFGRAYVKVVPALAASHTVMVLAGEPGWPISKFNEIGVYRGTFQPSFQENKSPAGQGRGEMPLHGEAPPMNEWMLIEWEFNDSPNSITIWVNGQSSPVTVNGEKMDVAKFQWPRNSDTHDNLVGGFQEFGFGSRLWGRATEDWDIYYDDIAIGTQRLGPAK